MTPSALQPHHHYTRNPAQLYSHRDTASTSTTLQIPIHRSPHHLPTTNLHPLPKMPDPTTFSHIPILPLSLALHPSTKPSFLSSLRSALLNVGFLYLSETGLPDELVGKVVRECKVFFEELPLAEKERIEMKQERSFLGWSRVS